MIELLLEKAQQWVKDKTGEAAREHIRFNLIREGHRWNELTYDQLTDLIYAEMFGLGPLQPLIEHPEITDILVNGPYEIYVEQNGRLQHRQDIRFRSQEHLNDLIQRIVAPLGRRFDRSSPFVDARLPDGSRIHAVGEPACINGPLLAIRRFRDQILRLEDLIEGGTCSPDMARFLRNAVHGRCNLVVSGGTGTGKTTTLNCLLDLIAGTSERLVIIEDAVELRYQGHAVRLEARPPNAEGQGKITIRELLRNALRMRPDRIVVGEVRDGAAWDMLQAMNTGHPGSLTTVHANSPYDCLTRIVDMILMDRDPPPFEALARHVGRAIDLVVQLVRLPSGKRVMQQLAIVDWDWQGWHIHSLTDDGEIDLEQTWVNKPHLREVLLPILRELGR